GQSNSRIFVIDEDKEQFDDLINYFYLLKEPPSTLKIGELVKKDKEHLFIPYEDFEQPLDRNQYYWGNFNIRNDLDHDVTYALYMGSMDFIEFYYALGDSSYQQINAGFLRPMSQRTDPDEHPQIVRFTIPRGETITCYVKAINQNFGSLEFIMELFTPRKIRQVINKEQRNLLQGVFQGILWIMIIYNLFFGILNKDRTYYYYAAYMFTLSLFFANLFGILTTYVFPEVPHLLIYIWLITQTAAIFYIQFLRHFLNLKDLLPKWDKTAGYINVGMIAFVIFKAAYFLVAREYGIMQYLSQVMILAGVILTIALVIALYKTKNTLARYFIFGSLSLGIAMSVSLFLFLQGEEFTLSYFYSLQIGIIAEIAFFSLGLGYKMRILDQERQSAQENLILQLRENHRIQAQANLELEQKVEERTQEIQLKNQELSNLSEEKSHLVGIVAHDLRNPLTSAMSVTELMSSEKECLNEDQKDYLKVIGNSLKRMNDMIIKILDVRAIESKKLNLNLQVVDVGEFVEKTVARFSELADKKNIDLVVSKQTGGVEIDLNYFTQVLENLLSNAIKFSPNNKQIEINVSNSGETTRLEVIDQGPGLTADDHKRIFGKYQRLSAKPTGGESSTGLGLSIAKKYVEAMKGKIWCESEEGKGAKFVVEFKAVELEITH
ncbi:MAG: sensor histidine kinase, partial [Bacteroidetes bacterium]|nr:sensor histidine kinase [Bacteroidota bacterium]